MKKIIKKAGKGIALVTALVMFSSPMTAFAQANPEETVTSTPVIEEKEEVKESFGPLTPNGNLTLVDDYGDETKSGKQFITVVTKAGNYFYIIIDRDDEGDETVHFLNMVDEVDLFSLMDDEEAKEYIDSITKEPAIEEKPTPEPVVELPPEPEKEKTPAGALLLMFLVGAGGIGGYIYLKKSKMEKPQNIGPDPDADYIEDEDYFEKMQREQEEDTHE